VRRHVHTTGEGITLVLKDDLLDLELREVEGSRDARNGTTRTHREDGGDGEEFAGDLNLLGQEVRRERGQFADGGRDGVRERQPNISTLRSDEGRTRRSRTAEGEDVVTSRGVGRLAESVLEELLTRKEILGRTTIAERNLLDESIRPRTRDGEVGARRPRSADGREFKGEDDVLNAVVGRDGEDGRPAREVGELLDVASVLDGAEALLSRRLGVGVVEVNALARADELLDRLRKR